MKPQKTQQGFTLIELLITIAIIAILATIAVPAYQTYIERARYTEVTQSINPVKAWVEDCFMQHGDLAAANECGVPPLGILNGARQGDKVTTVIWTGTGATAGNIQAQGNCSGAPDDYFSNACTLVGAANLDFVAVASADTTTGGINWSVDTTNSGCLTAGVCNED